METGGGLGGLRVAVVTGGGRGLGREIACRLAAEGVRVAVGARTEAEVAENVELIQAAGGQAEQVVADVADSDAVHRMIDQVEQALGPVDLLVNNAAVLKPVGLSWEVSPDEWWRLLETNLRGPYLCASAVLGGMTARRRGRIVNVASGVGLEPAPYGSAYVTSKAALIRLTEALALETEEYGVTVFAIDPGWLATAMTGYLTSSDEGKRWMPWASSMDGSPAHLPLGRGAELVTTLASGRADDLTGRFISVRDDIEDLIRRSAEIRCDDLLSMRLRS